MIQHAAWHVMNLKASLHRFTSRLGSGRQAIATVCSDGGEFKIASPHFQVVDNTHIRISGSSDGNPVSLVVLASSIIVAFTASEEKSNDEHKIG